MTVRATEIGHHLVRLFKVLRTIRAEAVPPGLGVDPTAYSVLFPLERGTQRLSDLAACTHAEVSTVSRQVSTLARLGLIEKQPDEHDGRAHQLALTPAGRDTLEHLRCHRDELLTGLLADWDDADVRAFAAHLARFADDAERWLTTRTTSDTKDHA